MSRTVDGAVDYKPRSVHPVGIVSDLVSVEINRDQRRSTDFLPEQTVRIDEEAAVLIRQPKSGVCVDKICHAVMGYQTVARREFDPVLPFCAVQMHWCALLVVQAS